MKMSMVTKSSVLMILTLCLIANAADRDIALEAELSSPQNNAEMLRNGATDPDGSFTTDYSPADFRANVGFKWDQAMAISQFKLYKKLGAGVPGGYVAPFSTRLVAVDNVRQIITQKFYYFEDETGVWGVPEYPTLTLLEVNFDPPIVVYDDERFDMYSWSEDGAWIKMDEVEIFGQEHVGCGDPCTVYVAEDINRDCVVDLADFSLIAAEWNYCTDPGDSGCDAYWPSEYDPNTLPPGY